MAGAVHTGQVPGSPALPLLNIYLKVGMSPCRDICLFMSSCLLLVFSMEAESTWT